MCTGLILINNIGSDGEVMPSQLTIIDHDGDGDALMVMTMEGKVKV